MLQQGTKRCIQRTEDAHEEIAISKRANLKLLCVNCNRHHTPRNQSCSWFRREKRIRALADCKNISLIEARKIVNRQDERTAANLTKEEEERVACAHSNMSIVDKKNKVQYLIVDTSAFIKNAALQDIGLNILTERAVIDEITNKRQLRRLVVLPYYLNVQEAFTENIKYVTEFSKKTGDYISLSATDIKIIALTYQLEKEKVGTAHLKDTPTIAITIKSTAEKKNEDNLKLPVGFYMPKKKVTEPNADNIEVSAHNTEEIDIKENIHAVNDIKKPEQQPVSHMFDGSSDDGTDPNSSYKMVSETENIKAKNLAERFSKLTCHPTDLKVQGEDKNMDVVNNTLVPVMEHSCTITSEQSDVESTEEEDNDVDDDAWMDDWMDDWITPDNLHSAKKQMESEILKEKAATVACLTMDFAMQNVLMQMGLNVATLDGRVIKNMRTFIFRCYACFKTTSVMTKIFCPHCGNKTLKKVEVTLDENGKQQIHINFKRPLSAKGKRFSLPTPKGGKHSNNPILCEDQPMPDQRPTHLARTKNNPLDDDYIAGYSPFIMRDINSRSTMLGIKPGGSIKYWMRKNPNESGKKQKY